MKAGTRMRSDICSGVAGGGSFDRSMNSLRSFSRTFLMHEAAQRRDAALERLLDRDLVGDQRRTPSS